MLPDGSIGHRADAWLGLLLHRLDAVLQVRPSLLRACSVVIPSAFLHRTAEPLQHLHGEVHEDKEAKARGNSRASQSDQQAR